MHSNRILIWGMSCVGKTTFAKTISTHTYYCFDALFPWHSIETLGLSTKSALKHVSESCIADRFVLDGWNLSDPDGELFPPDITIYVLYASYSRIIGQYRKKVQNFNEHQYMYRKWYSIINFPNVRFFKNNGFFEETSFCDYTNFVSKELIGFC